MTFRHGLYKLFRFLFPSACLVCGRLGQDDGCVCEICERKLENFLIKGKRCPLCSRTTVDGQWCAFCLERRAIYYFDGVMALFAYQGDIRQFIISFKFYQQYQWALLWARYLMRAMQPYINQGFTVVAVPSSSRYSSFDAIVYHLNRWGGGFTGIKSILTKKKGVAQKKLKGDERLKAIQGRIKLQGIAPEKVVLIDDVFTTVSSLVEQHQVYVNEKVVLIDDVFTTGATLAECAKVLKQHGSKQIYCIVLAID